MSQEVYRQLLEVMKKRGGGYSGSDIPEFYAMVEALFTSEEAEVNNAMPRGPFTAKDLAKGMGRDEGGVTSILEAMANKGLCLAMKVEKTQFYQAAPFMPGILEFQLMRGTKTERDKRNARLMYDYKKAFDAVKGVAEIRFPTTRVITVDRAIEPGNAIHTYDQVQTIIDKSDPIAVSACFCRHSADLRGEDLHGMPNDVCMQFGPQAQYSIDRLGARKLTRQEAREVINRAEEAGLIHMSQNMAEDVGFICNCDRWHCVAVQNALKQPKPGVGFNSGFEPRFDAELCTACETCIERCPAEALSMGQDDLPKVDLDRCFGCAVCATGCPTEAIRMVNKSGFSAPPKDAKALKEALKAAAA
jgi:Pyruvate/2-oxoacid:ferredoxin oxidoreductase delta subunit